MDKKIIIAMGGIFIGAFALGMVVAPQGMVAPVQSPAVDTGMISATIDATHEDVDRFYRIDVEYPQFDRGLDVLNGEIASYVNDSLAEFKTIAKENWKTRQDTMPAGQTKGEYPETPFTFFVTWMPKQINGRYISIIVRVDSYEGGAHGRQELRTFNYDVMNKKTIELADLFPGDRGYLGKVAKFAYDRLIEDLTIASEGHVDLSMIAEGTAPTGNNFKNFTFNEYAIELHFPKYQVAPGVFGEQRVMMPRKGAW